MPQAGPIEVQESTCRQWHAHQSRYMMRRPEPPYSRPQPMRVNEIEPDCFPHDTQVSSPKLYGTVTDIQHEHEKPAGTHGKGTGGLRKGERESRIIKHERTDVRRRQATTAKMDPTPIDQMRMLELLPQSLHVNARRLHR